MALEQSVVVEKLTTEGLDTKFADGVSFETEEALNSWVGNTKTILGSMKPNLDAYNADELRQLADTGASKSLQSLLDKVRASAKATPPATVPATTPPATVPGFDPEKYKEEIEAKQKAFFEEQSNLAKKNIFDADFARQTSGMDEYEKNIIRAGLDPLKNTPEDVKNAIEKYNNHMASKGLKSYRPASASGDKTGFDELKNLVKGIKESEDKFSKK